MNGATKIVGVFNPLVNIYSADCALKIQRKEADFGIFTAEEALLALKFINDDVRVIGKLKNRYWSNGKCESC